jgi:hypothetical protein
MDQPTFLENVITTESGWLCLALRTRDDFIELWFDWPKEKDKLFAVIEENKEKFDIYFSAHLFSKQRSLKTNVLPSRTIQADLDGALIDAISIPPTILVQTSPGRHQGYWVLKSDVDQATLERLSRKVTYAILFADLSGWSLGHKVRLPDTYNYKYSSGPKPVTVKDYTLRQYDPYDIDMLPEPRLRTAVEDNDWLNNEHIEPDVGPQEYLARFKHKLPAKAVAQYNFVAKDRSTALWLLETGAFRAGLTRDEVYWLARRCASNKFTDLRYNGDRELAKDVLRAEAEALAGEGGPSLILSIMEIRRMKSIPAEKKGMIFNLVKESLAAQGRMIRCFDDSLWYIRTDLGRPIHVTKNSEYLDTLLDIQFGLNQTEIEQAYVTASLRTMISNNPPSAIVGALSYYSPDTASVLLHTGRKDVVSITKDSISMMVNGSYGIIFPWTLSSTAFTLDFSDLVGRWEDYVFGDMPNVIGFSHSECRALVTAWFMFLLFRSTSISRPLLALFGQPGSGKSTTFRRIYALLYGAGRSIGSVTTPEDFDYGVSTDPLVVLDNVDSWEKWLPDRLALSASNSDIVKRKLYTDKDTITLRRQALIGLTAHSPKFIRADVADRLLLLNFSRLESFTSESAIINSVAENRSKVWGAIVKDVQKVLRTPQPEEYEVPQFRVEDFARLGLWVSRALGFEGCFRAALEKVAGGQKALSLEEETLLVDGLQKLAVKHPGDVWYNPAKLWQELETGSSDPISFRRLYHNAVGLARRMWTLQDPLKEVFHIEWKFDQHTHAKLWKISANSRGDLNG